uniref:Precorrin-8X methylmutase n=1 Tax=Candidatus Kentrum sp. TUN TaxID=2126343 RepID=A0A450ZIQ8_9GAMM|nr:MAG: precorrin-8X methylmutase [Candidatus Kentron sp. TUN]VFK55284.1 MAG: precorrin-8X methylmutase [Candidatus Kentron sp. TUN]
MSNTVTEQLTEAGCCIEHDSFAIVDREADGHGYGHEQWQVVRRMIHASADFEFNGLTRFHPQAVSAGMNAISAGCAIIVDVGMIDAGLSRPRMAHFGVTTHHFIGDDDVIADAHTACTTRAVQAMRKAYYAGLLEGSIIGVGNAPTALLETIRLIREEGVRPALVLGMPVGFVAAAQSKAALAEQDEVPWIVIDGRKGGSPLVVATLHALLALCEARQRQGRAG